MSLLTKDIFMKKNLGKSLLLFYVLFLWTSLSSLYAEDFKHTFHLNIQHPYEKEAILLTLELKQTNPKIVLFFKFDLAKSDEYSFQRVGIEEENQHHATHVKYKYLIYPLKSGEVKLQFKLQKQITNDESIIYSYSGDRDNVKGLVTKDSNIQLKPIVLDVKSLPEKTQIVGEFTLESSFKTHHAKVYEAIPFELRIKGKGYPPIIENIFQEKNITLFKEAAKVTSFSTIKGTKSTINYAMALSHYENFSLKPIVIEAFNPKTQKSYQLKLPKQDFIIEKVDPLSLVDSVDNPISVNQQNNFEGLTTFLNYLLVFIAGYLTALSFKWKQRSQKIEENILTTKIKNSKDEKELLQILIANDIQNFSEEIEALEKSVYYNEKCNFKEIKKSLLV